MLTYIYYYLLRRRRRREERRVSKKSCTLPLTGLTLGKESMCILSCYLARMGGIDLIYPESGSVSQPRNVFFSRSRGVSVSKITQVVSCHRFTNGTDCVNGCQWVSVVKMLRKNSDWCELALTSSFPLVVFLMLRNLIFPITATGWLQGVSTSGFRSSNSPAGADLGVSVMIPRIHANRRICESCGFIFYAYPTVVRRGCSIACGAKLRGADLVTHGQSRTRIYGIWKGMIARCDGTANEATNRRYHDRGISVCDEWHAFEVFRDWSLANGYRDDLEIDRIDNDGNYEPSNCRWATRQQQMWNTGSGTNGNSKYRGVHATKHGTFVAQCGVNGRRRYLGSFKFEVEAAKARDAFAIKHHGEFATLNFPS